MKFRFAITLPLLTAILLLVQCVGAKPRGPLLHDYHVCITQIDHNPRTAALEITIKIFTDDIERSIVRMGGKPLHLGEPREAPQADSILHAYLQNRLTLNVNESPREIAWVGKEVEMDAVLCFVEVNDVQKLCSLQITNRILTELFEDQANVVHVKAHGQTRSLYLNAIHLTDGLSL